MKVAILCGLLALGASGFAIGAEFSFGLPYRLTLARDQAGSVAVGDANGDGRMDLAVTEDMSIEGHRLSLFVQDANGTFEKPIEMILPGEFGWALPVRFADLDGDASEEIVVGMSNLLVARFSGGALSLDAREPAKFGCSYLATGDIDADGAMDIVCHSGIGIPTFATIFLGDGQGGFSQRTEFQTGAGSYGSQPDFKSLVLADVTGDGRPDLVVTASRVDRFFVYPNDGAGGFSPVGNTYPHPSSPSGVWPAAIQVLDIDGDGGNEVVTASPENRPDSRLNVYRRGEDGLLYLSERLPTHDSTTALLAADVDRDGDMELIAGHYRFNAVSVVGTAVGGLGKQSRFDLPGFGNDVSLSRLIGHSKSLAIGDINSDGCMDLAGATYAGVTLLYGCRPFVNQLPVSDFDGDGVSDLLWLNQDIELAMWQWADKTAWDKCARPCPLHKPSPWGLQTTGDFNGDGSSDTFWRNGYTGENVILRSAFYQLALTTVTNQDWQVAGAGDFDGDDQSDLLWRNFRTGANVIWRSGDDRKQQATRTVSDLAWQVVGVGDFNGDGRSDILWRHGRTGQNAIWLSGRFESQQSITAVTNRPWRVRGIGDFNGDGKDDVVWHNEGTGANTIWFSAAYSSQQVGTTVTNLNWRIGAVGDYDGDGRSDLMWRNQRTGENAIWRSGRYKDQLAVAPLPNGVILIP